MSTVCSACVTGFLLASMNTGYPMSDLDARSSLNAKLCCSLGTMPFSQRSANGNVRKFVSMCLSSFFVFGFFVFFDLYKR